MLDFRADVRHSNQESNRKEKENWGSAYQRDGGNTVKLYRSVRSWTEREEAERAAWSAPVLAPVESVTVRHGDAHVRTDGVDFLTTGTLCGGFLGMLGLLRGFRLFRWLAALAEFFGFVSGCGCGRRFLCIGCDV